MSRPASGDDRILMNSREAMASAQTVEQLIDGAGWHRSDALKPPENIDLLKLPPYAPELNPIKHIWDEPARVKVLVASFMQPTAEYGFRPNVLE